MKIIKLPRVQNHTSRAITCKDYYKLKLLMPGPRDQLLLAGLALCIRISDLLNLKVNECYNEDYSPKKYTRIKEGKTSKPRLLDLTLINNQLKSYAPEILRLHLKPTDVLFWSRVGPLRRQSVNRILNKHRDTLGLSQCSPHSLRKFQVRHLIMEQHIPIATVSRMLNHSHIKITEIYADIQPDDVQKAYDSMAI